MESSEKISSQQVKNPPSQARYAWVVLLVVTFSVSTLSAINLATDNNESLLFALGTLLASFLVPILISTIVTSIAWFATLAAFKARYELYKWLNLGSSLALVLTVFFSVIGPSMVSHLLAKNSNNQTTAADVLSNQVEPAAKALPQPSPNLEQTTSSAAPPQLESGPRMTANEAAKWVLASSAPTGSFWYEPNSIEILDRGLIRVNIRMKTPDGNLSVDPIVFNCTNGSMLWRDVQFTSAGSLVAVSRILCNER